MQTTLFPKSLMAGSPLQNHCQQCDRRGRVEGLGPRQVVEVLGQLGSPMNLE